MICSFLVEPLLLKLSVSKAVWRSTLVGLANPLMLRNLLFFFFQQKHSFSLSPFHPFIFPYICNLAKSLYLGLPILFGIPNGGAFKSIIDKVQGKIEGWRSKTLSQARRLMLIKSVAASIPTYAMSTFLFPNSFCSSWIGFSRTSGGVFPPQKNRNLPSNPGILSAYRELWVVWGLAHERCESGLDCKARVEAAPSFRQSLGLPAAR
ncbi:hypothetical protein SLA2020_196410 [Shorea laevis]